MQIINPSIAATALLILALTCGGCKSKDSTDVATAKTPSPSTAAPAAQPAKAPAASAPAVAAPAPTPITPLPSIKINSVVMGTRERGNYRTNRFGSSITNSGTMPVRVAGSCSWICPSGVHAPNGHFDVSNVELIGPGETLTLWSDSVAVCGDATSLPLQCSYTAQAVGADLKSIGKPRQALWSGDAKMQ